MKYYLITSTEYNSRSSEITQLPSWSLDNTKCIVEVEEDYDIPNNIQEFSTSSDCNTWRGNETTEEWRNWCSENFWNGADLDDF